MRVDQRRLEGNTTVEYTSYIVFLDGSTTQSPVLLAPVIEDVPLVAVLELFSVSIKIEGLVAEWHHEFWGTFDVDSHDLWFALDLSEYDLSFEVLVEWYLQHHGSL